MGRFSFVRNVLVLMSGTGASVAVTLLAAPLLTRIYDPEQFGVLAVFVSVLSIMLTCGSWCYEMAIPLAEDDETAVDVLALAMVILAGMTLIVCASLALIGERLLVLFNCLALKPYVWLIPVGFVGGGVYQILSYWALRKEAFGKVASTRLSQGVVAVGVQVVLGLLGRGAIGLLLGDLAGRSAGVGVLSRYAARSWSLEPHGPKRLRLAAVRYVKFPKFNVAANLLTSIAANAPVLILSRYFGPGVAGIYALSYRVLRGPITLFGQAVGQAFFARAASLHRNGDHLGALTERTTLALFTVGLPIFAFTVVDGPQVFALVFGESWRNAGVYARLLSPWFLLWLVANPLSSLFTIREWQPGTLLFSAVECIGQSSALLIGVRIGSDRACIAWLGAFGFCFSIVSLARFWLAGHTSALRMVKQVANPAMTAILCTGAVAVLIRGTAFELVSARFIVMAALYAFAVWRFGWLASAARQEAR